MLATNRTLIFVGQDEDSAVKLLQDLRSKDIGGALRSAYFFEGAEAASRVIIMEDVPDFVAEPIKAAFPGICNHREFAPAQTGDERYGSGIGAPADPFAAIMPAPKKHGRPPGSRNQPKRYTQTGQEK